MLGAIIGDIVGSRFEFDNYKAKDFDFFSPNCCPTDDSIMTFAVGKAILETKKNGSDLNQNAIKYMHEIGRNYPTCGYGGGFFHWMFSNDPKPYNSYGNGAAMRVSAAGNAADSLNDAIQLSKKVTEVTHNHPEGIKGAEATAVAIYLAKIGKTKKEISQYIRDNYYKIDYTIDSIRDIYYFNETCQETVPVALQAFFESTSYEDAIRNAISIGGDSDTMAAICGGVAEAFYGIPKNLRTEGISFLDKRLKSLLKEFEAKFPPKIL
ncbi:MAG: ADP-ribosylglycohydrolase family protein [Hallerella porci]|uniref:ADP-ribosylglycohydrolase n=1 Tax=Hallerella porci TaxID=1945871 RepID=A0ABX5LPE5_9BACT|nr:MULTISPECIES: ADP-ribosylglycohydrolase family protein [Hallerella]MCI5601626.1 ADP-ribosylglycohydrolase family protein [Hallerella sp.]MDY3921013.1 ADP-ribosylglycohydrolase family protein [Hallerella porci]PWL03764.1 ADP-ribosylglycohydrolase [Hallerella porci]